MRFYMKSILLVTAILSLFSCSSNTSGTLTEQSIKGMGDAMEVAVKNQDSDGIIKHFSKNAVIEVEIPTPDGPKTMKPSLSEYKTMMENTWAMSTNYQYEVINEIININSEKTKAEVTETLIESLEIKGQKVSMRGYTKYTVELVESVPLITRLSATVQM